MDLASRRRKNNLWKQILVAKYGLSRNGWDTHVSNAQESCVWRGILYVKDAFLRQIRVRECTSDRILFWLDPWNDDRPFASQFLKLFCCAQDRREKVATYLEGTGRYATWSPSFQRSLSERKED